MCLNRAKLQRKLSNLEMTVLGLAWLRGPCTTYAIMKELSLSASAFYKSRAGTAYSISKRLVKFGLLSAEGDRIRITEDGVTALREWLTPPISLLDVSHSADLIRLRFFFLGALELDARLAFIDNAIEGLKVYLQNCESLVTENQQIGDYFGALATLSSVLETRARIEWLSLVREWVVTEISPSEKWAEVLLGSKL